MFYTLVSNPTLARWCQKVLGSNPLGPQPPCAHVGSSGEDSAIYLHPKDKGILVDSLPQSVPIASFLSRRILRQARPSSETKTFQLVVGLLLVIHPSLPREASKIHLDQVHQLSCLAPPNV